MKIRDELPEDILSIENVVKSAFCSMPHSNQNEHQIVSGLRESNCLTVSFVAEIDETVVGHVAASPVRITDESSNWFGLGPVAVSPEHQKKGIGSRMVEAALKRLRSLDASGCVVLGDPGFYNRFGFACNPALYFSDVPAEYFQCLAFDKGIPVGEVIYQKPFY